MTACRVVSGLLVDLSGNILMGKRPMGKKRGGLWELPGGKVDAGEEPWSALCREWREELDLVVTVGDFICSATLVVEVPLFIELFEVRVTSPVYTIKNNAHDEVMWKDAQHMMEYEPCSPAYYLHYPWLAQWLEHGRRRG